MSAGEERKSPHKDLYSHICFAGVAFVFDVFQVDDRIDGIDVIEAIRGLNLNPTIEFVNSLGGREARGEISHTFDEFWEIYCQVRDDKNAGGYVDFVECLKIFDVGENGYMKLCDLTNMLLTLGERITPAQLKEVMKDCMLEEEDDDGWVPYLPFICRLCERPVPKDYKPEL